MTYAKVILANRTTKNERRNCSCRRVCCLRSLFFFRCSPKDLEKKAGCAATRWLQRAQGSKTPEQNLWSVPATYQQKWRVILCELGWAATPRHARFQDNQHHTGMKAVWTLVSPLL